MSKNLLYTKNINYSSNKLAALLHFLLLSTALTLWLIHLFRENSTEEEHIFGYFCLCYFGPIALNTSIHGYEIFTNQTVSINKKNIANTLSALLNGAAGVAFLDFAIKSASTPLIAASIIYPLDPPIQATRALYQLLKKPSDNAEQEKAGSIQEKTSNAETTSNAWCSIFSAAEKSNKAYRYLNPLLYLFGSVTWAYWSKHEDEGSEHFLGNLFFCANALTHLLDEWRIFQGCLSTCQHQDASETTPLLPQ